MEIADTHPDEYLAALADPDVRADMTTLDELINDALPGRTRILWRGVFWGGTDQTIIGYGRITQPRPRGDGVGWFLVGLARQKRNYSVYVNAVDGNEYIAHRYAGRLGRVTLGAASIGFARLTDIDLAALRELLGEADRLVPSDTAHEA